MEENELLEMAKKRVMGFSASCGLELESVRAGEASGSCPVREDLLNPHGNVHGGVISTLMDTLSGVAASFTPVPPRPVVTRSADVHFLRSIRSGTMHGRASVVRAGRTLCLMHAEVFDDAETLCAAGFFEFCYIDRD